MERTTTPTSKSSLNHSSTIVLQRVCPRDVCGENGNVAAREVISLPPARLPSSPPAAFPEERPQQSRLHPARPPWLPACGLPRGTAPAEPPAPCTATVAPRLRPSPRNGPSRAACTLRPSPRNGPSRAACTLHPARATVAPRLRPSPRNGPSSRAPSLHPARPPWLPACGLPRGTAPAEPPAPCTATVAPRLGLPRGTAPAEPPAPCTATVAPRGTAPAEPPASAFPEERPQQSRLHPARPPRLQNSAQTEPQL